MNAGGVSNSVRDASNCENCTWDGESYHDELVLFIYILLGILITLLFVFLLIFCYKRIRNKK